MRQVSRPVRRGAGRKGRKDLARSLPGFKVLRVLFLRAVSSAFLPSKKTCWTHEVRHLGDGQQYPPVFSTGWIHPRRGLPACRTTHSKNLRQLVCAAASFSTSRTLLACSRRHHPPIRSCALPARPPRRERPPRETGVTTLNSNSPSTSWWTAWRSSFFSDPLTS